MSATKNCVHRLKKKLRKIGQRQTRMRRLASVDFPRALKSNLTPTSQHVSYVSRGFLSLPIISRQSQKSRKNCRKFAKCSLY